MKLVAIVGAGRIGCFTAGFLAKQGIAALVIDRDFVEEANWFYSAKDVGSLKAEIVAKRFGFGWKTSHLNASNAKELLANAEVTLDCTDNWETRMAINWFCLNARKKWIFASCIRSEGMLSTIVPGKTPCFGCWNELPAKPRSCSVEGVSQEIAQEMARRQVNELISLLENKPKYAGKLLYVDVANGIEFTKKLGKRQGCLGCRKKIFWQTRPQILCGEHEYQFFNNISSSLEEKLAKLKTLKPKNLRAVIEVKMGKGRAIIFQDGRVLVKGLNEKQARELNDLIAQKMGY